MPDPLAAAAAPNGLAEPLKAPNTLLTAGVVVGVVGGFDVVDSALAGLPNGEGVDGSALPKNDPNADGAPNDGAPNVGLDGSAGVVVACAPKKLWPNTDAVCGVVALVEPGLEKKGEAVGVVDPNAPKPDCSLLKPVADVVRPPNAPPVGAGVIFGVALSVDSVAGLTGGVAGGVVGPGAGLSGEADEAAAAGWVVPNGLAVVDVLALKGLIELVEVDAPKGLVPVDVAVPNGLDELGVVALPNADFGCSVVPESLEVETAQTGFVSCC